MFAVKRALKLNNNEATLMAKHAGFRRVVFNMGLSLRVQMYGEGNFSDAKVISEIKKVLTDRVKKQPEFAWMNELSSRVYQNALIDLKKAFGRYRLGKASQAKTKLATLQRKAHRQIKGSQNQRKTYNKIGKLHARIARISLDFLHKLTTYLAKTFKLIKIEDLNVKGMLANHKLAGAIADLGFYEFSRQLEYKCQMYGSSLVLVDRWFPSSKICSNCGHKKDMPLPVRTYDCPACGLSIDRDLNASLNILNWEPSA
ncbi:MAG: RNA-guided endonuclease InsQ/TnpB family protein [Microcoleus sp.]